MQVRRDRNPLIQPETGYVIAYGAFNLGELSLGASLILATDQESAMQCASEQALVEFPGEEGYVDHHYAAFPVPTEWLIEVAESCPKSAPQRSSHHHDQKANPGPQRSSRRPNLEVRACSMEDNPECSKLLCFRQAVEFDERICRWRCAHHLGGQQ